jgi:hypothetical protein
MSTIVQNRVWFAVIIFCLSLAALAFPGEVQAEDLLPVPENNNCLNCHENLYLLHDTGNWFCLRESPMACSVCHAGDPTALTMHQAHQSRTAHPVVNEDITRCQACHQEAAVERVHTFHALAGIHSVISSPDVFIPAETIGQPINLIVDQGQPAVFHPWRLVFLFIFFTILPILAVIHNLIHPTTGVHA